LVHIYNNIPTADDIKSGSTDVLRGEPVWVFANGSDIEEDEEFLTAEFYYDSPSSGINWEQTFFDPLSLGYDAGAQLWRIEFTPPYNAELGDYYFMVRFTDSDDDYAELVGVFDGKVTAINNPPTPVNIRTSSSEVRATGSEYIFIHINGTDLEDAENLMTVTVNWQYNESGGTGWNTNYFTADSYQGSPDNGWLRVRFTPAAGAQLGMYDFRASVTDDDGDESEDPQWTFISRAVEVVNPEPTLVDVEIGAPSVYRGDILYIFMNATDLGEPENALSPEVQWSSTGAIWYSISASDMSYVDTNSNLNDDVGFWVISYTPSVSGDTGTYQFRARVQNSAQGYSNGGAWTNPNPSEAEVLNGLPQVDDIRAEFDTVGRGSSIYIYADGSDPENSEDELTAHFEYKTPTGTWETDYLPVSSYRYSGGSWRATFTPGADWENSDVAGLGLYDFKVWFEDEEGDSSSELELSINDNKVDVTNTAPTADALSVPSAKGDRSEDLILSADATDDDHGEASLEAIFEYMAPGGTWVGVGTGGDYFPDSPQYLNGHWQITFSPDADAVLGDYSFRVMFIDGDLGESDWFNKDDSYELENSEPTVNIQSPSQGTIETDKVLFNADADDDEDSDFIWDWDFGDGESSTEESPEHTYEEDGSYTVTVTITDGDGGTAEDDITINIDTGGGNGGPDGPGSGDGGDDMMWLFLILIIIIIVVVLLLVMLMTRKKKEPEVPPAAAAAPAAVPGSTGWSSTCSSTGCSGSGSGSSGCATKGCGKGGTADQMSKVRNSIHC
jgi:hypothetical protein